MRFNVIQDGNVDSFNYLMFPDQNPGNQRFIDQQYENMNVVFTGIGQQFMEKTRQAYEMAKNSDALRLAHAALRMVKGVFHPNMIIPLDNLEDFQMAQPIMQRYMMASPYIRELYQKNRCDGYRDSYVDNHPGKIGENHYDYRRVNQGIMTVAPEGEDRPDWTVRVWIEDLEPLDRELFSEEQAVIIASQEIAELIMRAGKDITNQYGGEVGR